MSGSSADVVLCPWCYSAYSSQSEWADAFYEKHPFVARVNSVFPMLNTPSPEAQFDEDVEK